MAEQRFCKPQVGGSIPLASSKPTFGWPCGSSSVYVVMPPNAHRQPSLLFESARVGNPHDASSRPKVSHGCSSEHTDDARWHLAGSILLNRYQAAEELFWPARISMVRTYGT